ncbi:hypothetical protein BOTBODRAFT_240429 [Botryobasidium botryosum FD-172 SS1]|uniref:Uncharacterized protein n=1 Tax=Botryobasidium botryosum (strain FD-172 SS1) TaxID=930990 RepID=A0A067MY39_BOTB1|nr:hypothetical protein BOTBODRAFT_240429 [Botryobasidium botryosum FD-172 SS1]
MCDRVIVFPHIPGPTLALTSAAGGPRGVLHRCPHQREVSPDDVRRYLQKARVGLGPHPHEHHRADDGWQAHVKALQCRNVSLAFRALIGFVCRSGNDEDGGIITLPVRFDVMEK